MTIMPKNQKEVMQVKRIIRKAGRLALTVGILAWLLPGVFGNRHNDDPAPRGPVYGRTL